MHPDALATASETTTRLVGGVDLFVSAAFWIEDVATDPSTRIMGAPGENP